MSFFFFFLIIVMYKYSGNAACFQSFQTFCHISRVYGKFSLLSFNEIWISVFLNSVVSCLSNNLKILSCFLLPLNILGLMDHIQKTWCSTYTHVIMKPQYLCILQTFPHTSLGFMCCSVLNARSTLLGIQPMDITATDR